MKPLLYQIIRIIHCFECWCTHLVKKIIFNVGKQLLSNLMTASVQPHALKQHYSHCSSTVLPEAVLFPCSSTVPPAAAHTLSAAALPYCRSTFVGDWYKCERMLLKKIVRFRKIVHACVGQNEISLLTPAFRLGYCCLFSPLPSGEVPFNKNFVSRMNLTMIRFYNEHVYCIF